ncbi:MAG: 4-hydroxythreonine-4-phosphate dehydrogenase PdxA [Solirubrobacteraceae bacterium]
MINNNKIRVGISMGDFNGISPEVILKSLASDQILDILTPIVFGSLKVFSYYKKIFNINLETFNIKHPDQIKEGRINFIDLTDQKLEINIGSSTEIAGEKSLLFLENATNALIKNQIDVLVTAPINKSNIKLENFTGHTEYLEQKLGGESLMFMIHDNIKVGLVTQHIPVEKIKTSINKELIIKKAKKINQTLINDFSISRPKIAVLGLNPHAGDNGLLGKEELEIIIPAIKELNQENLLVFGPYSADSFFTPNNLSNFDAVLAMYHDQGLIPFKTLTFGEGVNFTAGLDYIRTSPDHGVGYEIAEKNIAKHGSFLKAIYASIDIFNARKENLMLKSGALKSKKKS